MANVPATKTSAAPAEVTDASVFDTARSESLIEAGVLPFFTDDEKLTLSDNDVPLWILGARKVHSKRFNREFVELSITTDVKNPAKGGVWGGLHVTDYWRNMLPKVQGIIDATPEDKTAAIGPLYAHSHEYSNEHGDFVGYDFRGTAQNASDAAGVGDSTRVASGDTP